MQHRRHIVDNNKLMSENVLTLIRRVESCDRGTNESTTSTITETKPKEMIGAVLWLVIVAVFYQCQTEAPGWPFGP